MSAVADSFVARQARDVAAWVPRPAPIGQRSQVEPCRSSGKCYVQRLGCIRLMVSGTHCEQLARGVPHHINVSEPGNAEVYSQLVRDGNHTVADLMSVGKTMLGRRHVLPSVVSSLSELMIEGTFPTGTYLVTVHHPISSDDGDLEKALYGSFLPVPSKDKFPLVDPTEYEPKKQPGAVVPVKNGRITLNEGRKRIQLKVVSKGDRPIQVIWHYTRMTLRLTLALGWISLPLHRDEPAAGV